VSYQTVPNAEGTKESIHCRVGPEVDGGFILSGLWLEEKMNGLIEAGHIDDRFSPPPHTSLHVGTIKGGVAPNVIADNCSFHWDVRTIPQDNANAIYTEFEVYCSEREAVLRRTFPEFAIKTEKQHPSVPALDTAKDAKIVNILKKIANADEIDAVSYAAEAGQFAEGGFESIICGPGDIAQAHRANEFVAINQLNQGVEMVRNLVKELSY